MHIAWKTRIATKARNASTGWIRESLCSAEHAKAFSFSSYSFLRAHVAKRAVMGQRDHLRAFGSFIPPLLVPGPEAAREFTFSRSSVVVVVVVELLEAGGAAVEDDA